MENLTTMYPTASGLDEWLYDTDNGLDPTKTITSIADLTTPFLTEENKWSWQNVLLLIVKSIIMGGIILLSIMGNGLVIVSIGLNRKLHGITNYFLLSLAIADMLVALLAMTFNASVELSGSWMFGLVMCDLWNSFDVYFSTVSILHLSCISMDRYYAILSPLNYTQKMTKRKVIIMITIVWITPTLISFLPIFLGWYTTAEHLATRPADECVFDVNIVFALLSSSISFWIPTTVMLILYYRIYQEARKQETAIMSRANSMSALNRINRANPVEQMRKFIHAVRTRKARRDIYHNSNNGNSREQYQMCPMVIQCTSRPRGSRSQSICSEEYVPVCKCNLETQEVCTCGKSQSKPNIPRIVMTEPENEEDAQNNSDNSTDSPDSSMPGSLAGKIQSREDSAVSEEIQVPNSRLPSCLNNGNSKNRKRSLSPVTFGLRKLSLSRISQHLSPNSERLPTMKREHKAARTLGIILGAFILCWLPFFTWYVTSNICGKACDTPEPVITTLFWIGYFNSTLNPVIYAYFRKDFREAFMNTLKKLLCCFYKNESNGDFV